MAAPSTYKLLLQAQQAIKQLQRDLYVSKGFTIQQCMDMAMIALHEEFGFGPKYQARLRRPSARPSWSMPPSAWRTAPTTRRSYTPKRKWTAL